MALDQQRSSLQVAVARIYSQREKAVTAASCVPSHYSVALPDAVVEIARWMIAASSVHVVSMPHSTRAITSHSILPSNREAAVIVVIQRPGGYLLDVVTILR